MLSGAGCQCDNIMSCGTDSIFQLTNRYFHTFHHPLSDSSIVAKWGLKFSHWMWRLGRKRENSIWDLNRSNKWDISWRVISRLIGRSVRPWSHGTQAQTSSTTPKLYNSTPSDVTIQLPIGIQIGLPNVFFIFPQMN